MKKSVQLWCGIITVMENNTQEVMSYEEKYMKQRKVAKKRKK